MKEINGLLDTGAAVEMLRDEVPEGKKIHQSLTIRNIKRNGPKKGQVKARVCLNGKHMEVNKSHSPTMQTASLRSLIAIGAMRNAKFASGDFPQAYVNADNEEIIYMWPPASARQYDDQGRRLVWALPKALYGGKASGRYW